MKFILEYPPCDTTEAPAPTPTTKTQSHLKINLTDGPEGCLNYANNEEKHFDDGDDVGVVRRAKGCRYIEIFA